MPIIHILRDNRRVNDISGYVVKAEEAKSVYQLIDKINQRGGR